MDNLTPYQKGILDRYLSRRKKWDEEDRREPDKTESNKSANHAASVVSDISVDQLIREGKPFYRSESENGMLVGVAYSLRDAQDHVKNGGVVAGLPYLIAGKANATKKSSDGSLVRDTGCYLWKDWFTALSEEDIGPDNEGVLVGKGKKLVLTVHGGGILSGFDRIMKAYQDGLTPQNAASYLDDKGKTTGEFEGLLAQIKNGSLPCYAVEDVKQGKVANPFGRFVVWNDYENVKDTSSGLQDKASFMDNGLVIARAGTMEYLERYFELAKDNNGKVGNWHRLAEIDPTKPQGRVLFLYNYFFGLNGDYDLDDDGRFVGVQAPEAPGARK